MCGLRTCAANNITKEALSMKYPYYTRKYALYRHFYQAQISTICAAAHMRTNTKLPFFPIFAELLPILFNVSRETFPAKKTKTFCLTMVNYPPMPPPPVAGRPPAPPNQPYNNESSMANMNLHSQDDRLLQQQKLPPPPSIQSSSRVVPSTPSSSAVPGQPIPILRGAVP